MMKVTKEELKKKIKEAWGLFEHCKLCPRACMSERAKGEKGFCGAGPQPKVFSYRQYLGEEPPISGMRGSGVIFFSHCSMKCVYCQNSKFSQGGAGYTVDSKTLCRIMLSLQERGCHNINLVTPTHYLPAILESLLYATEDLLHIPIVYNTSGYESKEALELLEGVVDIYLTDMRYSDNILSHAYSATRDYPEVSRKAVSIMLRQVGNLITDKDGVAEKGLIIRHLVLPNHLRNTEGVIKYIAENISKDAYISLMSQYIPLYKARHFPDISRSLTADEYNAASMLLNKHGLSRGWLQEYDQNKKNR